MPVSQPRGFSHPWQTMLHDVHPVPVWNLLTPLPVHSGSGILDQFPVLSTSCSLLPPTCLGFPLSPHMSVQLTFWRSRRASFIYFAFPLNEWQSLSICSDNLEWISLYVLNTAPQLPAPLLGFEPGTSCMLVKCSVTSPGGLITFLYSSVLHKKTWVFLVEYETIVQSRKSQSVAVILESAAKRSAAIRDTDRWRV